jgi:hypothetical protein
LGYSLLLPHRPLLTLGKFDAIEQFAAGLMLRLQRQGRSG